MRVMNVYRILVGKKKKKEWNGSFGYLEVNGKMMKTMMISLLYQ